ncbi:MAG TPA: FtsW/RodA/SpoVE family cell cycle protein, partial [Syntrophales bacterium]|nr:FtsW/RodA/SpoVE family cell cycle protein [Syntrophales bacterium]
MIKFDSTDRSPDIILLIVTLILVTVGTVMIYSSSSIMAMERFKDGQFFLKKQMIFVVIGLGAMIFMTRIPYEELKKFAYPGVIISLVLLTLVLIPKIGVRVGGASRWLKVGFFAFQVTELVKIFVVLFLAHFLTRKAMYAKELKRGVVIPLVVTMLLVGLIVIEPDFGTAVLITMILM